MSGTNGTGGGLLRLDLGAHEPFWLEIIPGVPGMAEPVELLVEPYDTRVQYAVSFETVLKQDDIKEMIERARRGESPEPGALQEAAMLAAAERGTQIFDSILALARRVVKDWRGVGATHCDDPLPFSIANLEQLFRQVPQAVDGFNRLYNQKAAALAREKKVSGSAPNGTTAAGPDTAHAAGNGASAALQQELALTDSAPT